MLAAISFWTVRAQGIVWGYYNLFNIARMPDEAFRGAFKAMFTFALPVLLVSNVPVRVLADKVVSAEALLLLLGLGVIWAMISEWFWRVSVRQLHQRKFVKQLRSKTECHLAGKLRLGPGSSASRKLRLRELG